MSKSPFYRTGISKSPLYQILSNQSSANKLNRLKKGQLTGSDLKEAQNEIDGESIAKMKGSPLHQENKRKKGEAYITGSSIDETDFEQLNTGINVGDISKIQEDAEGQFITSISGKHGPYVNPTIQDTIRPKNGYYFKMGWDDNSISKVEKKVQDKPKEAPAKNWGS